MGKMKLTKENKKAKGANKGKSGIPNWLLGTVIAVIVVAVLATCVISFANSSGMVMRLSTAMKSEDYKVSGNMMNYFYANTYSNFTAQYESYMNYLSIGQAESISDHDDIVIGGTTEKPNTYDTMFFSAYAGKTWREYFMEQTEASVKAMLVYCEEADVLGISLDDTDKDTIESAIDASITQFKVYSLANGGGSLSDTACLAAMYGEGINKGDVRDAMELSTLATKCSNHIYQTIEDAVTEDRINGEYDNNKLDYDLADYYYYSFSVDYDDAVEAIVGEDADDSEIEENKDAILAKYKEMVAAAKVKAEALAALTDLTAFKTYLLNDAVNERYDALLEKAKLEEADKLDDASAALIKTQIITSVVTEALEGAEKTADIVTETTTGEGESASTSYKIGAIDVTETYAVEIRALKESLFTDACDTLDTYNYDKAGHKSDDDLSTWLFDTARAVGDIKTILEGDGKDGEVTEAKDKSFEASVYYVTKPRYRNETLSRDVAYMLFSSTTTAKTAIEKLGDIESLDKDKFKEMATELKAEAETVWEDYVEGQMGSASFDQWLFDEATVPGTLTKEPITMSDGSIMVAFYVEQSDTPTWKMNVKNTLIQEDFSEKEDAMTVAHSASVESNDWVLNRVGK